MLHSDSQCSEIEREENVSRSILAYSSCGIFSFVAHDPLGEKFCLANFGRSQRPVISVKNLRYAR